MSLLDDVSIVVTPNGYKAGELYAVVPVPTEGAEEIDDGSFANDLDDWSKYGVTSATGGIATIGASANSGIYQTILTQGVRYTVTINVVSVNATGTSEVTNGNGNNLYTITETGIQTFTFISAIASGQIILRGLSNALFSVSSVSVKEYTSADMDVTRATAATRVDENGLVNYAEIIGDDLTSPLNFLSTWLEASVDSKTSNTFTVGGSGRGMYFMLPENKTVKINVSGVTGSVELRYRTITGGAGTVLGDFDTDLYLTTTNATTNIYLRATGVGTVSVTDVSVKEVTRDNVPRIDYTGGGCPHILAEPQRTNLVTDSETFTGTLSQVNRQSNSTDIVDPFGTNTAFKFTVLTSGADANTRITKSISVTEFSVSIYVNGLAGQKFELFLARDSYSQFFSTQEVLSGGWQRIELNGTFSTASTTVVIGLEFGFTSDDSVAGQEYYLTGLQVEEGSYATSYIPTSGSTVTRNQDIFTRDGIGSLINSTEGVLFVEMAALSDDLTARRISINDGSYNNIVEIGYTSGSNEIKNRVKSGGGTQANMNYTAPSIISDLKIALKWKVNDFAVWVNGVEVATDTSGTTPIGLSQISFDRGDGTQNYFGKVKQLQVYKTALTDTQLAALTS